MNSLSSKHPLLILRDLEEYFAASSPSPQAQENYWSALSVQIDTFRCAIENQFIAEILLPDVLDNLSNVPGTKPWFRGLISLRGQALPVIDLTKLFFDKLTPIDRDTRIVVLNLGRYSSGVIVNKTHGLVRSKNHDAQEMLGDAQQVPAEFEGYISQQISADNQSWPVLDIEALGNYANFKNMAG